jgi:FtsH-binding integral membrane protein
MQQDSNSNHVAAALQQQPQAFVAKVCSYLSGTLIVIASSCYVLLLF